MTTVSFGARSCPTGSPSLLELLLFGVAAAVSIAAIEGMVSQGSRPLAARHR